MNSDRSSQAEQPETTEQHSEGAPATNEAPSQEQPSAESGAETPESLLPPEAQGEANGGPLGCCLGTTVGLLLSLSLAILSRFYAAELGGALQGNYWLLGLIVRILMGIMAFALAIFLGYLGWKLGKRFYREYEPPAQKQRLARQKSSNKK